MGYLMVFEDGKSRLVREGKYQLEEDIRKLIEDHPELIPLVEPDEAVYLVIGKEVKAADLLCVDQNGRITIIEFKLDKNQTMREVIAQVLDYASELWKASYEYFDSKVKDYLGQPLAEAVWEKYQQKRSREHGDFETWREDFQRNVVSSLEAGHFTFVIMANKIDHDIRRAVEYLYACWGMTIYCTELEYYRESPDIGNLEIVVPKLIEFGRIPSTRGPSRGHWDYDSFFEKCMEQCGRETAEIIREIYTFSDGEADVVLWGTGVQSGSFMFKLDCPDGRSTVFTVYSSGKLSVSFGMLEQYGVGRAIRNTLREKLNELPKVNIPQSRLDKWPGFSVEDSMRTDEDLARFKEAILWFKKESTLEE